MPLDLVPEEHLYAVLRAYRVDAAAFEAAVRQRIRVAQHQRVAEPPTRLSPLLKSAAAFLPLEILAGCKAPSAAKLAPTAGSSKLLGYIAFPAISLFVLLGATIFSIAGIRGIQDQTEKLGLDNEHAIQEAIREWWRKYKWGAIAVFAATLLFTVIGASWILFLFYLISFGILLFVLASFANF